MINYGQLLNPIIYHLDVTDINEDKIIQFYIENRLEQESFPSMLKRMYKVQDIGIHNLRNGKYLILHFKSDKDITVFELGFPIC